MAVKDNNGVNMFDPPKIMDATGKVLTKEELHEFMKMRAKSLEKLKKYFEEHKDDEMFKDFPR